MTDFADPLAFASILSLIEPALIQYAGFLDYLLLFQCILVSSAYIHSDIITV